MRMLLKTVVRTQGNNEALKDGTVKPKGFDFEFIEVDPLIDAFRRMVRTLEFDLSEMALTTFLTAREHGKKMTGIPVFLMRAFHHGAIKVNAKAGISSPKDLEGKRVGVNRGYTVTTGLWARSILAHQYGVDLSTITWVLSGDEHVAEFRPPANVVPLEKGKKMADALASGELPAAIGVDIEHPDVKPLIAKPKDTAYEALRKSGHYPINHLLVIKDETLAKDPSVAARIFEAFAEAKRLYVEKLRAGAVTDPAAVDETNRRVMEITGRDPLPYGIEPNRAMLEEAIRSATEQKILTKPVRLEDLFAESTRALAA
jgi:4,5-dihydroxyphthalate decarboxylase